MRLRAMFVAALVALTMAAAPVRADGIVIVNPTACTGSLWDSLVRIYGPDLAWYIWTYWYGCDVHPGDLPIGG